MAPTTMLAVSPLKCNVTSLEVFNVAKIKYYYRAYYSLFETEEDIKDTMQRNEV
jgi:hypothetical protein